MERKTPISDVASQVEASALRGKPQPKVKLVSAGATLLDLGLGGGYPVGRIINLVGDRSTGKTLLASENIAHGGRWKVDPHELQKILDGAMYQELMEKANGTQNAH